MAFTDDDLKRLKEYVKNDTGFFYRENGRSESMFMVPIDFDALIARLEAAEAYIKTCREYCCDIYHKEQADAYEAWRKAAGKEG